MFKLGWLFGMLFALSVRASLVDLIPAEILPFIEEGQFTQGADQTEATPCMVRLLKENVFADGKRLRPILVYLGAGLVRVPLESVREFAIVAEMNHSASLVHDDFLDGDSERRGRPSVVAATSPTEAVLLGDYLMAWASQRLARVSALAHERMMSVIMGMATGEFYQSQKIQEGDYSLADWEYIAERKTGRLFGWSLGAAAMYQNLDASLVQAFNEVGVELGALFQLRDDMLDADEFGEVNYLHRIAADRSGGSVFDGAVLKPHLPEALNYARAELQARGEVLKEKVRHLSDRIRGSERSIEFQHQCEETLIRLIDLIISA